MSERDEPRPGILAIFSTHPVAANLLMVMMLLAGVWGIRELNTQFFPSFDIDYATVVTAWSGASAGDVEELITISLEQELRDVDYVKEITSTSSEGSSVIVLEFEEGTDMGLAVASVKERVDLVRNLPQSAETPQVSKVADYDDVTNLLVAGGGDVSELRALVRRFENELLERGIAKIEISGLPKEEIAIEVPTAELRRLQLSLDDIGRRVAAWSQDVPVGIVGRGDTSRQLRFRERRKSELDFESIPVRAEGGGRRVTLGDIAHIERRERDSQVTIRYRGKPAVVMALKRTDTGDSLKAARIFNEWLAQARPQLPDGVELVPYDEDWRYLRGRIELLIKNGAGGLVLVILMLFLFMSGRVAWWTAVGIPVSFMAALAALNILGGSINMLSLFGLIMALGIIVDDAIVVGEEAMTRYEQGARPRHASELAARQMLGPVFSSSLTTIAAFTPLLIVGGIIGSIMQAIPVVVICVIIASLIECFLILPGHLTHSFRGMKKYTPGKTRKFLDGVFEQFRDKRFRPAITAAVANRWVTLAVAVTCMLVTIGWIASGRINFSFFPTAEENQIYANVGFVAGAPASEVKTYLAEIERALFEVQSDFGEEFIKVVTVWHGATEGESGGQSGDHFGAVVAELTDPDQRRARNRGIVAAWKEKLPDRPGIERLTIIEPRAGPPGDDFELLISGGSIARVKQAAQRLQDVLAEIPGVSGISDDSPYGREQMVLQLTPTAEALGLSVDDVSRQLRAAYDGYEVQEISDGYDDIKVRLMLPRAERDASSGLSGLSVVLPNGGAEPIGNLATISRERGFESIRHANGKLTVTVTASIDDTINNDNRIRAELEAGVLPQLVDQYGVSVAFEGRQADQEETLGDMKFGVLLAFALIYLVLAWVFGSYGWPLVVMFIIPFGLVGAIWGHVVMGLHITILSLFGFFALSGIVVNDSIILVVHYKHLREGGMAVRDALIGAACRRLRPVILTSLTTIAGLSPLLFETSLQAQFLIPMAATIAFGLAFATLLVLFLIPALLLIYENAQDMLWRKKGAKAAA